MSEDGASRTSGLPDVRALSRAELAPGSVALVGGGPGALDLVTVRGLALLGQADVVVVDRLGPSGLVDLLGETADGGGDVEVIPVGKTPGGHSTPQREIERILIDKAREGKRVVRLKGGDPFVLGRGGEEVLACRAAGVSVQVVPGVTSAIAGPALGGVPVTHRGTAVAIHVVNAHGDLGPADLAALRDPGTTTVLMMGVEWLPRLVRQALLNGVDPRTPVAVVQNASLPEQREVRATLGTVVEVIHEAGIGFPAVITVGRNAAEGFLEPEPLPGSDFSPVPQDIRGSGREALPGVVDPGSPVGPTAVLCAHGTHSRQGRDVIRSIMSQAAALLPGTPVREAYVDVQSPEVRHVVATVAPNSSGKRTRPEVGPRAVVVPLLLATGYHVRHDIGDAVRGREAVAAPPLGPDVRIAQVLAERLREAGAVLPEVDRLASAGTAADPSVGVPDAVVLAVAGTRDEAGAAQAHVTAQQLSELIGTDVRVGYVAAASPSVAEAVAAAREEITAAAGADTGRRVVVASCLLVPGYFQSLVEKAAKAGADVVTAPLGDHELLAQIVADRFLAAVGD